MTEIGITWTGPADGRVDAALTNALRGLTKLPDDLLRIAGMSGRQYRILVNELVGGLMLPGYLEIGLHHGSTFASAIYGNSCFARGIDNWSQYGADRGVFNTTMERFATPEPQVSIIDRDFRTVDYGALPEHDVYFFDGPHEEGDHYDAVKLVQPALASQHILIVDDWNAVRVREGTLRGIKDSGLTVEAMLEIRTAEDDAQPPLLGESSNWHHGVMVASLRKPA